MEDIQRQIDILRKKISESKNPFVIESFKKKIQELEKELVNPENQKEIEELQQLVADPDIPDDLKADFRRKIRELGGIAPEPPLVPKEPEPTKSVREMIEDIRKEKQQIVEAIKKLEETRRESPKKVKIVEPEEESEEPEEEPEEKGDNERYLAALLKFESDPSNENRKTLETIETTLKILYVWKVNPIYPEQNPKSLKRRLRKRILSVSKRLGIETERKKTKSAKQNVNKYDILEILEEFRDQLIEYRKERFVNKLPKENFDKTIIMTTFAKFESYQNKFSKRFFRLTFSDMDNYAKIDKKLKKVRAQIRKLDIDEDDAKKATLKLQKALKKISYNSDREFEVTMQAFYEEFVQENLNLAELILDELKLIIDNLEEKKDQKKFGIVVQYYNALIDSIGEDEEEEESNESESEYDLEDPLINDDDREIGLDGEEVELFDEVEDLGTEKGIEEAESLQWYFRIQDYKADKLLMTPELEKEIEQELNRLENLIKTTRDDEVLDVAKNARSNMEFFQNLIKDRAKKRAQRSLFEEDEEEEEESEAEEAVMGLENDKDSESESSKEETKKRERESPPKIVEGPRPAPVPKAKTVKMVTGIKRTQCQICQSPANFQCCEKVIYCGQSCQRQDFARHKGEHPKPSYK